MIFVILNYTHVGFTVTFAKKNMKCDLMGKGDILKHCDTHTHKTL